VLLYVDESNRAAVTTYERLGFAVSATDVCYARG
jgi:ribosomal protein S18 acetylase RimI-like enzyme